jgi:hypothetical protein
MAFELAMHDDENLLANGCNLGKKWLGLQDYGNVTTCHHVNQAI